MWGGYVTFVDSDDWIEPSMYEILIYHAEESECEIVGCSSMVDYENGVSKISPAGRDNSILTGKMCNLDILYQTRYVWGAMYNKLYARRLFENIRFPDIMNLEDYVVSTQIFMEVDRVYFYEKPMYHYTCRQGSLSKTAAERNLQMIDTAKTIRECFIKNGADRELLNGTDYFIYLMCLNVLWGFYKNKPEGWKCIIREKKIVLLKAFSKYLLYSKKQKRDAKKFIQLCLILCI